MKKLLVFVLFLALVFPCTLIAGGKGSGKKSGSSSSSHSSGGAVHVKGYYRKDGTYVAPHYRSAPDGNFDNNWSTKGNVNPYTGKVGTKTAPSYPIGGYSSTPDSYSTGTTEKPIIPDAEIFEEESPAPLKEKPTIPKGEVKEGKVVGVTDGDTMTILVDETQYKIRLLGIDAPESGQPYGKKAKTALSDKIFGKEVKVLSKGQDKYGRTLGIVIFDGRLINIEMIKEGMAWHYKQYNPSKILESSEDEARKAKIGLWADEKPVPPWEWRHPTKTDDSSNDPFDNAETKPNSPPPKAETKSEAKQEYWMTDSSSKRHNSSCRYFHNSKGHPCGPNDGIPCKICGG